MFNSYDLKCCFNNLSPFTGLCQHIYNFATYCCPLEIWELLTQAPSHVIIILTSSHSDAALTLKLTHIAYYILNNVHTRLSSGFVHSAEWELHIRWTQRAIVSLNLAGRGWEQEEYDRPTDQPERPWNRSMTIPNQFNFYEFIDSRKSDVRFARFSN